MPRDRHNPKVIHPGPSHVRDEHVAEVMKYHVSNPRALTGRFESTADGPDGFATVCEHVWHALTIHRKLDCRLL
jgi:hypothetical protein